MVQAFVDRVRAELAQMSDQGLSKPERVIRSRQGAKVRVREGGTEREVLNFCANNYLGLAGDERIAAAAIEATRRWGAGTASVRFICGTLEIHKELEADIADYLGFEDAMLLAAAFDANGAVFEPLFTQADAIVSDVLNHASIIDGIRLSKARRYRYQSGDMDDLETQLRAARASQARDILIVTDGVFSMDGYVAKLVEISALAERYAALVMVDDCHATGIIGPLGRGSFAKCGVRVDIVTGTFGKALGGAMGGFICARREIVDLLRQRGRPYLFSNALAPGICGASLAAISVARRAEGDDLRRKLAANAALFRGRMQEAGFELTPGDHPIIPVMLGDAHLAQELAREMLSEDVLVTAFSYPVVPHGKARIRTQMSAAHDREDIERAVLAFDKARARVSTWHKA